MSSRLNFFFFHYVVFDIEGGGLTEDQIRMRNAYSGRGDARQDNLRTIKRVHRIVRLHLHGGHLPAT